VKTKHKPAFALEDTLAVYGIRSNPFPVDETDEFFFSTPILAKQMDVLRNLVEYGDLLLVISGVEGAGKTTFLNQFLLTADKRWKYCRLDAREEMTVDSLVDGLLRSFGLNARGDEALLRAHLADIHANGDVAMVAVDDAHLLPQICTEFLLRLAEERGRIELRLLLTTEPGRLGFSTNDAKHVHVVVLQPFDLQQSGDYLHTRLRVAGLVGDSPFSASMVGDIQQDSGGLPGAIHPSALHTLLANTEMSQFRSGLPRRPASSILLRPRLGRPASPYLVRPWTRTSSIHGLVTRCTSMTTRTMVAVAVALVIAGGAAVFLALEAGMEPMAAGDAVTSGEAQGPTTSGDPQIAAAGRGSTDDQKRTARIAEPFSESVTATVPVSREDSGAPMVLRAHTSSDAKVLVLDENGISMTPAVAVTSPANAKAASAPAKAQAAHDLDWLRKQEPSHYVIQVVGTRDASAVSKFLDDHELGSKGAWFVTTHESKPWYVVVYGLYPDKRSARAAIERLPERLRAGSPWPRSVASVIESTR
jgi:DamX protein